MDVLKLLQTEERSTIEEYVRSQARCIPADGDRVLVRVLDSFLMYLDMRDTSIAPHIAMDGYWEFWATIAVARYVKPGMRCIDVGASFGYYTMLLAQLVGEEGRVQAWEPLPPVLDCLRDSVAVNGLEGRLDIVGQAAAQPEAAGSQAVLCIPSKRWGDAGFRRNGEAYNVDREQVDLRRAALAGPIDFIKIDAEGYEAEVWAGMQETLKHSPRVQLMVEFTPEEHERPEVFLEQIVASGFSVRLVADDGDLKSAERPQLLEPGVKLLWLAR